MLTSQRRQDKLRVLHVLGGLNPGGCENWLKHLIVSGALTGVQCDFLVHTNETGAYETALRQHGCRILKCPRGRNPPQFVASFVRLVSEFGPYDIIHCHYHYRAWIALIAAKLSRVPIRVAHAHNDTSFEDRIWPKRLYARLNQYLVSKFCTHGLATSDAAGKGFFGREWGRNSRLLLHLSTVDLTPFGQPANRSFVRSKWEVDPDTLAIGHVGRFTRQKNHQLLVEIAVELRKRKIPFCMLLVGDGPLRASVLQTIRQLGLTQQIRLLPPDSNVVELMTGVFDCFLFPSLFEGLGLSVLEAQAAGLPCIISDRIPKEAIVDATLIEVVSLTSPCDQWVDQLVNVSTRDQRILGSSAREEAMERFGIQQNGIRLVSFYYDSFLSHDNRAHSVASTP